jgi:hypothetical protein
MLDLIEIKTTHVYLIRKKKISSQNKHVVGQLVYVAFTWNCAT